MKVLNLTEQAEVYTSNVYLVTGSRNAMEDVNTLIDVGQDPHALAKIGAASTGVGKKRIAQVILTHNHYDHTGMLPPIRKEYRPVCYAFSTSLEGIDRQLYDGQHLKCGDRFFEVIHTPGHSTDSVCLYCADEQVLFSGDTPLRITSHDQGYADEFVQALVRLGALAIETVYPGHGDPYGGGTGIIRESLGVLTGGLRREV